MYEAALIDGWVKSTRILALIEKLTSYAFFVFNVLRGPNGITDVIIDYAFPINDEFKINVG